MEVKTNKKSKRLERKTNKMRAFLEIATLNDNDRTQNSLNDQNKESDSLSIDGEPHSKRLKTFHAQLSENDLINDNSDISNKNKKEESPFENPLLADAKYKEMKKKVTRYVRRNPGFRLKEAGEQASISVSPEDRIPIFLSDIQHLILFTALQNRTPYLPTRWCTFQHFSGLEHVAIFVVENISFNHYTSNENCFEFLNAKFHNKIEVVTPSVYKGDLVEELVAVPLTSTQKNKLVHEHGSLEAALKSSKVFNMIKAVFPVEDQIMVESAKKINLPENEKFPRTYLLLSAWQMVEENYPLPLKGNLRGKYADYVLTKDVYEEVTPNSPMFGLDCEMCKTTIGDLELTRISVVNEKHESCYESLIKPYNRITDYLTQYSGITPNMLKDVTIRLEDVQRDLRELLPADAILVGQSLNSDMHSLKMMHPYVIDTSVIFNITGNRYRKTKLKTLAKEFLNETIQQGHGGHDSIEDSLSSLKLVQLKLKHDIEFGDAVLSGKRGCQKNYRNQGDNYFGDSLLHHVTKVDKTIEVIADATNILRYKRFIHNSKKEDDQSRIICVKKSSNKSIMRMTSTASTNNIRLTHVTLQEEELDESNVTETCNAVDEWVKQLWTNMPLNTLCIVLFGGDMAGNGACFIDVRKAPYVKRRNK